MHFNPIVLLALIAGTGAFLIPEGMEDGVYDHYVDENGQDVHVKVANHTGFPATLEPYTKASTVSGPSRVMKRWGTVSCGEGGELNHHDTDWTNSQIDLQCSQGSMPPNGNKWAKSGDVIAFVCNFMKFNWQGCSSTDRSYASQQITAQCGWYKPGWWTEPTGTNSYGYYRGMNICGYTVS